MTVVMPEETMAAYVRGLLEEHDEWDSMPKFMILDWDGEEITVDTLVGIAGVEPSMYPTVLSWVAAQQLQEYRPDETPYAYLLFTEGWAAEGPGPPPSQRPDRVEIAFVICADIEGRVWQAEKRRDRPGEITGRYSEPGSPNRVGGRQVDMLLSMAARARDARVRS